MSTKTWSIFTMYVKPIDGDLPNVVTTVYWQCTGVDGVYVADISGSTQLLPPDSVDFTAYADITEQVALGWVFTVLGSQQVAEIEAGVDQKLNDLMNPPIVTLPLPWPTPGA